MVISRVTLLLSVLLPIVASAEQFVDLTAEIETFDLSYHLFVDGLDGKAKSGTELPSIFTKSETVHCVTGTNVWFMESVRGAWYFNGTERVWFTGTNIIRNFEVTEEYTNPFGQLQPVGTHSVIVWDSFDGNPGRPIKVQDLIQREEQIPWFAFCSGSALRVNGRQLYPPFDLWKETTYAPHGFTDQTTVYNDAMGLPVSVELFANTKQKIFRYQVHQTTNVLGWNFPLEFYMVQYQPDQTNGWAVSFTSRGRITAIKTGARPQIPESVLKAIAKKKQS